MEENESNSISIEDYAKIFSLQSIVKQASDRLDFTETSFEKRFTKESLRRECIDSLFNKSLNKRLPRKFKKRLKKELKGFITDEEYLMFRFSKDIITRTIMMLSLKRQGNEMLDNYKRQYEQ
jgi:hypothetical protein